jgi:hypothetical protein
MATIEIAATTAAPLQIAMASRALLISCMSSICELRSLKFTLFTKPIMAAEVNAVNI